MNSRLNVKVEPQNVVGIANAQTLNFVRTENNRNAICLMTGGGAQSSCDQVTLSLPAALPQTNVVHPVVKLNPVTLDLSARELISANANSFPVKYIIAAKSAPQLQQSSQQDCEGGRIQEQGRSFILGAAGAKLAFTATTDTARADGSACQDLSEQDISKRFSVISLPLSSKNQEIVASSFGGILQIKDSSVQSATPIKFAVKPIVSQPPQSFSQQFRQKMTIATAQPSYSGPQAVLGASGSQLKVLPASAAQLQILSNEGKFQYVKLVTTSKDQALLSTNATAEPLKLLVTSPKALPSKIVSIAPSSSQDRKKPVQRMILPATFRLKNVVDNNHVATSVLATDAPRVKPIGAFCVTQTGNDLLPTETVRLEAEITSIQNSNNPKKTVVPTALGSNQKLRRPCNCSKSHCLKLYCECFANGEFCSNCNCNHCLNNLENENHRQHAIRSCLSRNPQAFHPKIGKSREGEAGRQHCKGCHCKRSGCLKNYCECYEAKIPCTEVCRCHGCKNYETSTSQKSLMHLASAAEVRVQQQLAATTRLDSHLEDLPRKSNVEYESRCLPHAFLTLPVVDAIGDCLLETAEKWEQEAAHKWKQLDTADTETAIARLLLEEFGRCTDKLIAAAGLSNR